MQFYNREIKYILKIKNWNGENMKTVLGSKIIFKQRLILIAMTEL